jgi:hypothetical protein
MKYLKGIKTGSAKVSVRLAAKAAYAAAVQPAEVSVLVNECFLKYLELMSFKSKCFHRSLLIYSLFHHLLMLWQELLSITMQNKSNRTK